MFSSILGLYWLESSRYSSVLTITNVFWHCQMSPIKITFSWESLPCGSWTTRSIHFRNQKEIFSSGHYGKDFPGDSDSKESAYSAGDWGSVPESGRSSGEGHGNPLQCSCLENSMDRGAWQAAVHGSQRVRHHWAASTFTFFSWESQNTAWNKKLGYLSGLPWGSSGLRLQAGVWKLQGAQVQSSVRELRFHVPYMQPKQTKGFSFFPSELKWLRNRKNNRMRIWMNGKFLAVQVPIFSIILVIYSQMKELLWEEKRKMLFFPQQRQGFLFYTWD